jgi:hypothetical protein
MSKMKLLDLFKEALSTFFQNETKNILSDVSERNLCARLAYYLEALFSKYDLSGYYADSEYNRKQQGQVKTILDDKLTVVSVTCDVIVHSRGEKIEQDNLIAIEMKKSNRPQSEKESDRDRLKALTKDSYDGIWSYDGKTHPEHVCGYSLGFYIEIDKNDRKYFFETYHKGNKVNEWVENF